MEEEKHHSEHREHEHHAKKEHIIRNLETNCIELLELKYQKLIGG